ncbi:adenylate/guanylate cyclase domain-containing protein [Cohnella zeiphila]|uniref:HAMP domain-containing protein n=1 Tax=Cohnella zeiphila TaxID=2761120 RepID=A0A7X0VZI4_9BACL|nr:adenylate/guanylate cyclase domain-containing protein [Cohnella zeiphila]MBB6735592.1 HAMP domain-containing protein [Cohnella zeiphila]
MRKISVVLLVAALVIIGLTGYGLTKNGGLTAAPWKTEQPVSNLSAVAPDTDGSLVAIGSSKQEILRIASDGSLRLRIPNRGDGSGNRSDFTEAAAAPDGQIAALRTVLDPYGLYVTDEQIVLYDGSGRREKVLYERPGDGKSLRIGQIKGLQVQGGELSFFEANSDRVTLRRVRLDGSPPEKAFSFQLPPDRYLSEVTGTQPGQIYYTTKRGSIFRVGEDGTSTLLYPLDTMERTRKNFPELLTVDASGKLLFVDRLLNSVMSMAPGDPSSLKTVVDEAMLEQDAPGLDSYEIMDARKAADGGLAVALNDRLLRLNAMMGAAGIVSQTTYESSAIRGRWLLWIGLSAGALLLAFAARHAYVHLFRRRFPLFLKQLAVIVPVIVVCMILLSNFIYDSFSSRMESQMQSELSLLARNGQHLIDGDALDRLRSPEDYGNADYQAIKSRMNFLFEGEDAKDRKGLYSTLYKVEDGQLYIVMDDDDGVNMFKPFEKSEENEEVLTQGVVRNGQWEDADGKWLYAIGPVYDSAGKIVGIYETGRDMSVLERENQKIYRNIIENIVIITSVLLAVIAALNFLLLTSIRKLRRSVMDMAGGNWDAEVKIRSRDEVGDLGEQFNRMARYIRQYIADITSFSEASYRFVPQQFFRALGKKGILDVRLGDQVQQNMTVLVANLRDFRQLSRTLTPKENFNFMNSFLKRFGPIVRKEDGLISKYSGAGFMSLFPGHPEAAIRAAVAIRQELTAYNEHRQRSGFATVDIGIAMHKGPLMMGIIGEEMRWESNVISDDVQRTTLLEQITDTLGASILVTKDFFGQLRDPERYGHRSLGRIRPDGMEEAVELIDVFEGDPEPLRKAKERTKALFERGLELCQEGRFFDARETFVEVLKMNRQDKAAKLYFFLCDEYFQKGTSAGWNGTLAV